MNILRTFPATEKDYNLLGTVYCVLRRYYRSKNITGFSPNDLVFVRQKMGPKPLLYHPRQCYHTSEWFEKIKDSDSKWIRPTLRVKHIGCISKINQEPKESPSRKVNKIGFESQTRP